MRRFVLALLLLAAAPLSAQQSLDQMIDAEMASLLATYKQLHAAPELSTQEAKTSGYLAAQLRSLGYTVAEKVGKYEDPSSTCYGVVAVMKNGAGPTVLVRSDMDALPVTEQTGVAYASQSAGVMHACGHDGHIATLMGVAQTVGEPRRYPEDGLDVAQTLEHFQNGPGFPDQLPVSGRNGDALSARLACSARPV